MLVRAGDIEAWVERAAPGDRETYGRGARPPGELVRAMRPFVEAQVLIPIAKREGDTNLFMVERGSADAARARRRHRARNARGRVRRQRVRRSEASRVFACLADAVRRERPCPTNLEIARRCGLKGKQSASYRLHRLEKQGRIAVDGGMAGEPRVVTILTGRLTGQSTKAPFGAQGEA